MMLKVVSAGFLILVVSGCVVSLPKDENFEMYNMKGDYDVSASYIIASNKNLSYYVNKHPDMGFSVCEALYKTRMHKEFKECFDVIEDWEREKSRDHEKKPLLQAFLGELHIQEGEYEKALRIMEPLAQWDGSVFSSQYRMYAKLQVKPLMPTLYNLMGDKAKAREAAIEWEDKYNSSLVRMTAGIGSADLTRKTDLAKLAVARGDYEAAYNYINEGYRVGLGSLVSLFDFTQKDKWAISGYRQKEVSFLYMSAYVAYMSGHMEQAKETYEKLLQHEVFSGETGMHYNAYHQLGDIARSEGDIAQAIDYFVKAVDVLESERSSINSEVSRIGFVGNKQAVYSDLVSLLIEQGRYAEAFEFAERGKSRALVDTLASKQQFASKGINDNASQLLAELDKVEYASRTMIAANATAADSATRGISVVDKKKAIYVVNAELASLVTVSPPSTKEIQKQLGGNETVVEYYGEGDILFAFVLSRTGIHAVALDGARIKPLVGSYRKSLSSPQSSDYQQSAQALYDVAVKPVVSHIKSTHVTIVPHGALHYAPFAALYDGKQHLVDKYQLRVLPSASVLSFLNKPAANKPGTLLALGNPDLRDPKLDLPGAQEEALNVARLEKGAKVLLRQDATETALKKYGPQFKRIHFAMHGQFDDKAPLSSGLLMSKDGENDGRLTVSELYELNLDTDLVTLSACQTALGETASGDDVIGFTRGFLYAGAQSIVSSLWEVDDAATRDLMVSFYTNLKKHGKGASLQKAQQKVKAAHAHPYYWAAFQLTGKI